MLNPLLTVAVSNIRASLVLVQDRLDTEQDQGLRCELLVLKSRLLQQVIELEDITEELQKCYESR